MTHSPIQASFAPPQHQPDHYQHQQPVSPSHSQSSNSRFWPFNRSRSSSPNSQAQQQQQYSSWSRKSSPNPQQAAFVVKTVTKQPGGVTLDSAPNSPVSPSSFHSGSYGFPPSSPARRMKLDDSDDDLQQNHQAGGGAQLNYRRSKSKPLASAISLGVPPGGPGGGTGYGTALSSSDGRPESVANNYRPLNPPRGPTSPQNMTAGGFVKGLRDRGRSGQRGQQPEKSRSGSRNTASPTPSTRNSSSPKPKVKSLVSVGPKSWAQQQLDAQGQQQRRSGAIGGPRQFPGSTSSSGQWAPPSPSYSHRPQDDQTSYQYSTSPRQSSPLATPSPLSTGVSAVHAKGHNSHSPLLQSEPDSEDQAHTTRARRISFGFGKQRKVSGPLPPVAPVNGLPSPIKIPSGARSASREHGDDTDYSYGNGASPFGSVSPGGSPGFFHRRNKETREMSKSPGFAPGTSPNAGGAGKWFKGMFGRSPKPGEGEPGWEGPGTYSNRQTDIASDNTGFPPGKQDHAPYGQPPRSPTTSRKATNFLSRGPAGFDELEGQAMIQKRESQRLARKIVDEERRKIIDAPITQKGFDPLTDVPWTPKQAVGTDEEMTDEESPQRRSPPGRKPVPTFVDDSNKSNTKTDGLSKLEDSLTPAQRIIQETRSKQLAREQTDANRQFAALATEPPYQSQPQQQQEHQHRGSSASGPAPSLPPKSEKGIKPEIDADADREGEEEKEEIPVRRSPTKGKRRQIDPPPPLPGTAVEPNPQVASGQGPGCLGANPVAGPSHASGGLSPGVGPMPIDMSLTQALQEMMIRFYRFERYSVPLIRSLETRLLDIERDAMLAYNPAAAGRRQGFNPETSSQHEEMDRWVGQMTKLMKHEVGQLKAATKEIKEGRELIAAVARRGGLPYSDLATESSGPRRSTGIGSISKETLAVGPNFGSPLAQPSIPLSPEAEQGSPSSTKAETGNAEEKRGNFTGGSRMNNFSSASFNSAVPRSVGKAPPSPSPAPDASSLDRRVTQASSSSAKSKASSLVLPPGARPALDKDEGKFNSSAASINTSGSNNNSRERSVSPSGRRRYTTALGEPMRAGRISPGPGNASDRRSTSPTPSLEPPPPSRFQRYDNAASTSAGKNHVSRTSSPSLSDSGSISSGASSFTRKKREQSVEERLKALVGRDSRSRSSSLASSTNKLGGEDMKENEEEEEEEDEGDVTATGGRIGDDYSHSPGRLTPVRSAGTASPGKVSSRYSHSRSQTLDPATSRSRNNNISSSSTATAATLKSPPGRDERSRSLLTSPTTTAGASSYIGGRTSPSPSSFSALKKDQNQTGLTDRRSTSPSPLLTGEFANPNHVPPVEASEIKTSSNASNAIRARAQSYLSNSSNGAGGGASSVNENSSNVTTTVSWMGSGGLSPKKTLSSPSSSSSSSPSKFQSMDGPSSSSPNKLSSSAQGLATASPSSPGPVKTKSAPKVATGMTLKERVAFFDSGVSR